jgi:hypothetical protein
VVTTSQPLPLEQATFSLRLLSQWTSWLSLVAVAVQAMWPVVAVVLEVIGLLQEHQVAVQALNQPQVLASVVAIP